MNGRMVWMAWQILGFAASGTVSSLELNDCARPGMHRADWPIGCVSFAVAEAPKRVSSSEGRGNKRTAASATPVPESDLPRRVALPSTDVVQPQTLFSLPASWQNVELSLSTDLATLPDRQRLEWHRVPGGSMPAWQIVIVGPDAESTARQAIAEFTVRDGRSVVFRWYPPGDMNRHEPMIEDRPIVSTKPRVEPDGSPGSAGGASEPHESRQDEIRQQVVNGILRVRAPPYEATVLLRVPEIVTPIEIDFDLPPETTRQRNLFDVPALPRREQLCLEVTPRGFPGVVRCVAGRNRARIGEVLIVEFGPEFGAQIEVRWVPTPAGIVIVSSPRVAESPASIANASPLTLASLAQVQASLESTRLQKVGICQSLEPTLVQLQRRVAIVEQAITSEPRQGINRRLQALQERRAILTRDWQRAWKRYRDEGQQIGIISRRLALLDEQQKLIEAHQGRATLACRLFALNGAAEVELFVCGPTG